jgi:hypothetical protein
MQKEIESTENQIFTKNMYVYIHFILYMMTFLYLCFRSLIIGSTALCCALASFSGSYFFYTECRTAWTRVCICTAVRDAMHFISLDISYKWQTTKWRIFRKDVLYLSNFLFWQLTLYFPRTIHATFHHVLRQSPCRSEDTECAGPTGATRRTVTNELTK